MVLNREGGGGLGDADSKSRGWEIEKQNVRLGEKRGMGSVGGDGTY